MSAGKSEAEKYPPEPGTDRLYAVFYRFAARVERGEASEIEDVYMVLALLIAFERGDLNVRLRTDGRL